MTIESIEAVPPKPWGIIATVLWVLLALFFSGIASGLALVLRVGGELGRQDLMNDGPMVSLMVLILAAVQVPVLIWAAQSRGWRAADYLGWVVPKPRDVAVALAAIVVLALATGALHYYLLGPDPPVPPPFQTDTYRSAREAGRLVMLWIAFVVAAPLSEELLFRGFLYRGWARSPRAVAPAVVVISAIWAIAHVQYDWFLILQLFVLGLVLGWARWYSGSTMLTFAIHASINGLALVQTTWTLPSARLIG